MGDRGRRRREVGREARGAHRRHARRSARSLLRDARAAEVPQDRPHRGRGDPRGGQAPRDEPAGCRLHDRGRGARAGHMGRGAAGRRRTAGAARRCARRGLPPERRRGARWARGPRHRGLRRAADLHEGQRALAVSLRQRPPGARQTDARRGARRLRRLPAARPPSGGGAVRHRRAARGRRERASGQDRGALPRLRTGALVHRARPAGGARARQRSARRAPAAPRLSRRSVRTPRRAAAAGTGATRRHFPTQGATALAGFAEAAQAAFDTGAPVADARVVGDVAARTCSTIRSVPRARSCTKPTSWRRRATAS